MKAAYNPSTLTIKASADESDPSVLIAERVPPIIGELLAAAPTLLAALENAPEPPSQMLATSAPYNMWFHGARAAAIKAAKGEA